jgi:hypothetical protein
VGKSLSADRERPYALPEIVGERIAGVQPLLLSKDVHADAAASFPHLFHAKAVAGYDPYYDAQQYKHDNEVQRDEPAGDLGDVLGE